jgi:hypothetical protein
MTGLTSRHKLALLAIPVFIVAAFLVAQALVADGNRLRFWAWEVPLMKALAAIGLFLAASRYRRGEYMGVAWALCGLCYSLLLAKDLLFGRVFHVAGLSPATATTMRAIFVVAANVSGAAGSIMLARVWRVAGIALPGSRASQTGAFAVSFIVAVAIIGWGLWRELHSVAHGEREAIIVVASNLGDVVSFIVIAPLMLTAIAMRGGTLAWPWALITASNVCWLLYDMSWMFERQLGEATLRSVEEFWRAAACALALVTGMAQRWAIRSARRG